MHEELGADGVVRITVPRDEFVQLAMIARLADRFIDLNSRRGQVYDTVTTLRKLDNALIDLSTLRSQYHVMEVTTGETVEDVRIKLLIERLRVT
jgi:hypothetical protein